MATRGFWLLSLSWTSLAAATAFAANEVVVQQKDIAFLPNKVSLAVGDTLAFTNEDSFGHNMHSEDTDPEFDLGRQAPGAKLTHVFRKAGTFEVLCRIHPKMRLEVVVR
jgi:plastocyanin